jgi:hypothetical protein
MNLWIAPPPHLPTDVGTNRSNWDLRYDPPPAFVHTFEINANPGLTPASPVGPLVAPGTYTVKLTVDGRSYATKVTVTNDPRSPATTAAVRAQVALQLQLVRAMGVAYGAYQQAAELRGRMDSLGLKDSSSASGKAIAPLRVRLDSLSGKAPESRPFSFGVRRLPMDFVSLHGRLEEQFMAQENGDLAPTETMRRAFATTCHDLATTVARWNALTARAVPEANTALSRDGKSSLPAAQALATPTC